MKKRKRAQKLILGAVCLVAALLMVTCDNTKTKTSEDTQSKYGGVLKVGYYTDVPVIGYPPEIRRYDPVQYTTMETLLRVDKTGAPTSGLATEWKVAEDSSSITLELRKGVKFHDGTIFDADAVKWNLDQYRASDRTELAQIASVVTVPVSWRDARTF